MIVLFFILLINPIVANADNWFEAPRRGIFYYDDPKHNEIKKQQPEPQRSAKLQMTANQWASKQRQRFNEALNQAIKQPSYQNVLQYKKLEQQHLERATDFSDMVKLVVLKNPELNYALKHPSDHNARLLENRKKQQQIELSNQRLAVNYGLFFFFSTSCRHCHAFAPTLRRYANKYQIPIMAISVGGGKIAEFPDAQPDNGIARKFKVTHFPAVYAVDPKQIPIRVIPIAYGNISVSAIEENVYFMEKMLRNGDVTKEKL